MPLHAASITAVSTEPLEAFSTCLLTGGTVRQATTTDTPTHYVSRYFPSGVSAGIVAFERGHRYRCVLSGSCSADQDLLQDSGGQLNPLAAGPKVGRAAYAGVAGDIIEFVFEPDASGGGGGLNAGDVNTLIDTAVTRSFIRSSAADDTPPVDSDWPEGSPNENDELLIVRTPVDSRRRNEFWVRAATVDTWNKVETETPGATSSPRRSEFTASQDIPANTAIDMNAATASYTNAQGLDYTSHDPGTNATYASRYNVDWIVYVNGEKLQQADVFRSDSDPAGHIQFNQLVPAGSEIVFESQVLS